MKRPAFFVLAILTALSGCGDAYHEKTTPRNCACGDWYDPTERTIA